MSEIEDLLRTIDEGLDESQEHNGEIRAAPSATVNTPAQIEALMRNVQFSLVAEWYQARCLGCDEQRECSWYVEDDQEHNVIFDAALHVAQTGHSIHIDISNVRSVTKKGEP